MPGGKGKSKEEPVWFQPGAAVFVHEVGICCVKRCRGSTLTVKNQGGQVTKVHRSVVGRVTPKVGALVFARARGERGTETKRAIVTRLSASSSSKQPAVLVDVRFFDHAVAKEVPLDDRHVAVCLEKHCSHCGRSKAECGRMHKCACCEVFYCSRECQRRHWAAVHKKYCKVRNEQTALQNKVLRMFNLLDASGQLVEEVSQDYNDPPDGDSDAAKSSWRPDDWSRPDDDDGHNDPGYNDGGYDDDDDDHYYYNN
eukprot:CAMPEP_0118909452 /NCGR_PEP_ID=MMETSP1166-20130328/12023_1 /TAXON_ID=1104430 /ORGANISM="Chrysoreinhardia sp, Strain CCMP3193" /LENGTH=254 /DNA_ID=CAMNT_0006848885 /DNA_START=65 /DNA_END=829 /DNA_ORIENTATION=+